MTRIVGPLLLIAAAPLALAGNWPQWRGPTGDGISKETNLPTKWDDNENVAWKLPLPGPSGATPIVWGDRIFVLTAIKTDRKATATELPKPDPRFERKTEPPAHFYKFVVLCYDRTTVGTGSEPRLAKLSYSSRSAASTRASIRSTSPGTPPLQLSYSALFRQRTAT